MGTGLTGFEPGGGSHKHRCTVRGLPRPSTPARSDLEQYLYPPPKLPQYVADNVRTTDKPAPLLLL